MSAGDPKGQRILDGFPKKSSYRGAFVRLNKTGERRRERHEPPAETPQLLAKAVNLTSKQILLSQIASDSGIGDSTLKSLLKLLGGDDQVFDG